MFQDNEAKVNEGIENSTEKSNLSFNIQVNVPSYDSMGFKEHNVEHIYKTTLIPSSFFKPKEFEFLDRDPVDVGPCLLM